MKTYRCNEGRIVEVDDADVEEMLAPLDRIGAELIQAANREGLAGRHFVSLDRWREEPGTTVYLVRTEPRWRAFLRAGRLVWSNVRDE